jgi:hypothetical protein
MTKTTDTQFWTDSANDWAARAAHFADAATFYATRGTRYSTVIVEMQEEAAYAYSRAIRARLELLNVPAEERRA